VSLTAHLLLDGRARADDVFLVGARARMAQRFGILHCTFQLEHRPCPQARGPHGFGPVH
jgi:hypothetical protein